MLSCAVSSETLPEGLKALPAYGTMMSGKRHFNDSSENKSKLMRRSITLEMKMEVLKRLEAGERQVIVSRALNLPTSSIRTILRNAGNIKARALTTSSLRAKKITRSRSSILEKMESRLNMWVEDQTRRHKPLSQHIIMEKARSIFNHLKEGEGEGSGTETFSASRGWFARFKRRSNLLNMRATIEVDEQAAQEFPETLKKLIERGDYPPQLVFNVGETGLFWKRMPSHTFISREEEHASGFKAAKDRLTLLLGGNASGDFKLRPMLIYQSETPRAMTGFSKEHLPVIWKSNKKALVTVEIFTQWYISYFCPAVTKYCEKNKLQPKALLIIDNAPGYPQNLDLLRTCLPVQVVYLPTNTKSLLQPMDQGVVANFKAYYLRCIFKQLAEMSDTEDRQMTIREFWKTFNIMNAIDNIKTAWEEVTETCMNAVWRKLWPDVCGNFQEQDHMQPNLTKDLAQLANEAGLEEVDVDNIVEVLLSHGENLTNEELEEMEQQHVLENGDDIGADDTEPHPQRNLTTAILSEGISKITEALELFSENDPDWERSSAVKRCVLNSIYCYQELLREKKKRVRH